MKMHNSEFSFSLKEIIPGVVAMDAIVALMGVAASWLIGGWTLDAFAETLYLAGFAVIVIGAIAGVVTAIRSRGQHKSQTQHRGNVLALVCISAGMSLLFVSFLLINYV
jgi:hypothetical protein